MDWLGFIVMGVVAGWLAGRMLRGNGFGLDGDIAVGVAGALLGGYLMRSVAVEIGAGVAGRLLVALGSGLLLLFVVRLFTGRKPGRRLWY